MARLVTDIVQAEARSRITVLRLVALILRLRAGWSEFFGDADTAAIVLAVAAIHSDRLLRDQDLPRELGSLEIPLPEDFYGYCNIASISVAAGLNRETTRRKVLKLEQDGIVVRNGSNIRLASGLAQSDELLDVVSKQIEAVRKTADDLLRDGVFMLREMD